MTATTLAFDPYSEQHYNDPYDIYRRLRDEAPVYYSEQYDFFALSRHTDVASAFKNHEVFSSASGVTLDEIKSDEHLAGKSMIWMDPPEHRQMRSLVNKVFTPRAMQRMESVVDATVTRYLSRVTSSRFDVVDDFSAYFPVEIITTMLGVPEEHRQQMRILQDVALQRPPGETGINQAGVDAMIQIGATYYALIQERRQEPRDDMISALIDAEVQQDDGSRVRLDDMEIAGFCVLLGGAGAETVTKLIGTAVVLFSQHPDQWRQLRDDRSKIPAAVEEVLRYEGPVQYDMRCTTRQVEVHGVTIPEGAAVMLLGASANRDSRAFTAADTFDINRNRAEAQNLGFGYGIHSCLGAALARMESRIALDRLLDALPEYRLDEAGLRRVAMTSVNGYSHVPVQRLS